MVLCIESGGGGGATGKGWKVLLPCRGGEVNHRSKEGHTFFNANEYNNVRYKEKREFSSHEGKKTSFIHKKFIKKIRQKAPIFVAQTNFSIGFLSVWRYE